MKTLSKVFASLTLGLVGLGALRAQDLPAPPEGFTWKKMPEVKAAFLVPTGWHFKHEIREGTLGYFITAERINQGGLFATGLTLNVMPRLKSNNAMEYAKAFVAKMSEENELVRSWRTEMGLLHGYGCLTKNHVKEGQPAVMMHTLAIGNSRTNTLYILWFESPEPAWEEAWGKGAEMLRLFFLDDEF